MESKVRWGRGVIRMMYKRIVVTWGMMRVWIRYEVGSTIVLVALRINIQPKDLGFQRRLLQGMKIQSSIVKR